MKRFQLIGFLALVLVFVGVALRWRHFSRSDADIATGRTNAVSEVVVTGERKPRSLNKRIDNRTGETKTLPDFAQASAEQKKKLAEMGIVPGMTKEQMEEKFAEWYRSEAAALVPEQKPIEFYGKVVDEQVQGVSGANIHFIWSDASSPKGTSDTDTISSNDGSFSLTGVTGSRLSTYVSKEGYYVSKSLNGVDFDTTGNNSSKSNPVLFHLRKKRLGADLITSQYGVFPEMEFSTPRDGSPMRVDFFTRKAGNDGQLELTAVKPARGENVQATEWSFRLSIPDGGFVEHRDEFPFEAPESGYQPTIEFHFKSGDSNWTDTLQKQYYIAFGQPRKYGRINLGTGMYRGVNLGYAINPDGSRYLEPK